MARMTTKGHGTMWSLIVFLFLSADISSAGCPQGWYHFQDSCFYFSSDRFNWFKAETSCRAHDARLAEIYDKPHSDYLMLMAKSLKGQNYWLGGRDDIIEGRWVWASTDLQFNYTAWAPGKPDNVAFNEDCVLLWGSHHMLWNDALCDLSYRFICEKQYQRLSG